jgi:putative chitinase
LRLAHFLAQCHHESGGFLRTSEGLSYSAERLMQVWPKRFPDKETAKKYEHDPMKLGNYVYANRLGNGNEASGDGYRFRGRGYIQITGRSNYYELGRHLGIDLNINANLVATTYALISAGWFWHGKELNELADQDNCTQITHLINGGYNGLHEREALVHHYKQLLSDEVV